MANNPNDIALTPHLMQDFQQIYGMILSHRKRAAATVDNEMLLMIWEVGGYVSHKLKTSAWGEGVVRQLSDYIRTQDPTSRGWSYRTVYKMVQLYEAYSRKEFEELVSRMNVGDYACPQIPATTKAEIVPIEMAQIQSSEIVQTNSAQLPKLLTLTSISHHMEIITRCKTAPQRLFYILYSHREPFNRLRVNSKNTDDLYIYSQAC